MSATEPSEDPENPSEDKTDQEDAKDKDGGDAEKNGEVEIKSSIFPKYFQRNDTDSPAPLVLEPNHPMMQRFQIALKNHLLKQVQRLTSEVFELDNEVKKKEKEREATGVTLYTMQQELYRQQKTLENCQETIEELMKERETLDENLNCKRLRWKEEVNKLNAAKKKENEMLTELHKLAALEKQMEKWERELDSDLAVSQRISEKTQADKNRLIEEKRKLDMYLLRLMTEVSKLENESKLLDAEIDVKTEEKETLNQTLADATADLQALISEQKRLFTAWNAVIVTMAQRDAIYADVSKELLTCQEAFRALNAEIESYKRSAAEEMKKNEQWAIMYGRAHSEHENNERHLQNLFEKKSILEQKISTIAAMTTQSEKDLQLAKIETANMDSQYSAIQNEYQKLCQEKHKLEDEILSSLHDQLSQDKAAAHLNRLVKEIRDKTRKQEFAMVELENKISKRFLEVEELKSVIARNNEILNEMNKELDRKEQELKANENEINKFQLMVIQKQGSYAVLLRKIEKQMEKSGTSKLGQSPLQLRIVELEKMNSDLQEKNDKMQRFWLVQQNNNVKLTQQRNEQLKDISILRKQVVILDQRTLKTEMEIEKEKKIEADVNKSIANLQHKLVVLNETLVGKKGYRESLDKENSFAQTQFVQKLKDSELEQLKLKEEIENLEDALEELAETMLETQREMLAWEKKIKVAIETKQSIQREKSSTGEVGQMKLEIHRMEVRYSQLKKAQDKLINDLEQCVLRRDALVDGADAKEKRQLKGFNTRFMFQKKLEDLKNKIRAVQNERRNIEKIIHETEEGHQDLLNQMNEKTEQLKQLEETSKQMDRQLEDGKLHKQQNLEMLVRRQKKCKLYNDVKLGKYKMMFRNELALENEMQNVKAINANLISVAEQLIEDFPAHRFPLMKIFNTFRAKPA